MAATPVLIDSNVLVYAFDRVSMRHGVCRGILDRALSGLIEAVLVPQVLFEFYAILTTPQVGPAIPAGAVANLIDSLSNSLLVLPVPVDAVAKATNLARDTGRGSQGIWDLFLVAQMQCHGISTICTTNVRDVSDLGIRAVTPETLVA